MVAGLDDEYGGMITITLARHDAVWAELNQLRELREMASPQGRFKRASADQIAIQAQKCRELEDKTTSTGA